jgi:hypothetical protein
MSAEHVQRSIPELRRLLALAKQLGFQDDVEHWQAEIEKVERAS